MQLGFQFEQRPRTKTRKGTVREVLAHRATKREEIAEFFTANLGQRFGSSELHVRFGTSFRTRVSDLNKDSSSPIVVRNQVDAQASGSEHSFYWAEWRQ
jgi:hypothetical protein